MKQPPTPTSITEKKATYEILCVDTVGNCPAKTEKALCYAILSHSDLLNHAELTKDTTIFDKAKQIYINIKQIDPETEVKDAFKNAFLIKANGPFGEIEPLRIKLLNHLKDQKFEHQYILLDEVSSELANQIYPQINSVENALRKYLIKFLVTKLGPSWWNVTADAEMQKKIVARKNNESTFSNKADNKAYLIDFGELGKIVYAQSSGFINRDDIYAKVMAMDETESAVQKLKMELQSNYTKFFKDTFKDKNFQQKWEELEKIRHKVAHNSLFIAQDKDAAHKLCAELLSIIQDANKRIDELKFSENEREAIMDRIVTSAQAFQVITRDEMIKYLKDSEKWAAANSNGFIGMQSYIRTYLGKYGYDYAASFEVLEQLEAEGVIEIYDHKGEGHERSVKAIRFPKKAPMLHHPFANLEIKRAPALPTR